MKTHAKIDGKVRDLYKKNGLLTSVALHEGYVNRKALTEGYARMHGETNAWVVEGFNPKYFSVTFYDLAEAERFYKKLR